MKRHKQKTHSQQSVPEIAKSQNKSLTVKNISGKTPSKLFLALSIFVVSFLLYSNTLTHGFVLDDEGIISANRITRAPVSWENTRLIFSTPLRRGGMDRDNSLYRPLSKLVHNIEWNLFDGNPHPFHLVSVILFSVLGLAIFLVLYDAFQKQWLLPFLTTILFVVHPIHTEAVANIKGREEIISLLSILISIRGIQLYLRQGKIYWLFTGVFVFLFGLFSKESTVVAVALFPIFIYFFTETSIKKNLTISLSMMAPALFFIACRWMVLHSLPQMAISEMDNVILLANGGAERFATAVGLLGMYILKFIIPYPLSSDYSYTSVAPIGMNDPGFLISFIVIALMLFYILKTWKNKNLVAFGFLWFFISISLVSNIFFTIGTSFGERLLFVPSLGLCLSTVMFLYQLTSKHKAKFGAVINARPLWYILAPIFLLFSFKTYSRNQAWKSDYVLYSTDVKNYPSSIHLLYLMGYNIGDDGRREILRTEMEEEGFTEKEISDSLKSATYYAILFLSRSLSIHPSLPPSGYNILGKSYDNLQQYDSAYKYYMLASSIDTGNAVYINNVGIIHFIKGRYNEALPYFQKAYQKDTTIPFIVNNLGRLYGQRQMLDSAIYWFNKAQSLDSLDHTSLEFLEMTWRAIGNIEKADYYKKRIASIQQKR